MMGCPSPRECAAHFSCGGIYVTSPVASLSGACYLAPAIRKSGVTRGLDLQWHRYFFATALNTFTCVF